jgi:hypothetical protein
MTSEQARAFPAAPPGAVNLKLRGGGGDDLIICSDGAGLVDGGSGNDTALMGAGNIQRRDRGHRQADRPSAHNRRRPTGPAVIKIWQ